MKLPRHIGLIGVAVIIVIALVFGFLPKARWVDVAIVSNGSLQVIVEEEGKTRVIDRYVISAPVDGVACRLQLHVGDPVEQGQMLLGITPLESQVLDPRSRAQAQAQVAAAKSALRAAKEQARAAAAAAQLASKELKRLTSLMEQGLISRDAFDKAATEAQTTTAAKRSADFNVDVAKYELQAAQTLLEYSAGTSRKPAERVPIRSPITGKILKVARECEGPVRTGEPLLEVGDPSALEIEVDVLSADAVQIKPGMRVVFERWGGEHLLEGRVRLVEPVGFTKVSALGVEEQRVLVITDITSDGKQWQRLGDGYRVEAKFILWEAENVLQIPASALFRHHDGWAVFVMQNGRASRRMIKLGQRNGLIAQIVDGLAVDETVIIYPDDTIKDGRRVKVRSYD